MNDELDIDNTIMNGNRFVNDELLMMNEKENSQLITHNSSLKKGYKQTEVGVIPEDWEVESIHELINLMTNGFVGSIKPFYAEYNNGVLYIQGYNVLKNGFKFKGIKYVTKEFHDKHQKSKLKEGDLLTVQTGDVGVTTVVPKSLEGSNCHALIITRFKQEIINSIFYAYYFNSEIGRARLKEIETGSTMKHINVGHMKEMLIPLPPTRTEQTAIATALSDMDSLIEGLEKLLVKKRNIKQGAMQELLSPYLMVNGKPKKKEEWVEKEFDDIFTTITSNKYQIKSDEYKLSGKYPIIDQGKNKIIGFSDNQLKVLKIPIKGIIVFGDHTRIIKFIDFDFIVGADGTRLLSVKESYSTKFLFQYLVKNEVTNTGYNRHFKFLKEMIYKLPKALQEQTRIANILSDMDTEIEKLETQLSKYKMLKTGMMQELLTGKKRLI